MVRPTCVGWQIYKNVIGMGGGLKLNRGVADNWVGPTRARPTLGGETKIGRPAMVGLTFDEKPLFISSHSWDKCQKKNPKRLGRPFSWSMGHMQWSARPAIWTSAIFHTEPPDFFDENLGREFTVRPASSSSFLAIVCV